MIRFLVNCNGSQQFYVMVFLKEFSTYDFQDVSFQYLIIILICMLVLSHQLYKKYSSLGRFCGDLILTVLNK